MLLLAQPTPKKIAPEDLYLFLKANARIDSLVSNASKPLGEKLENIDFEKMLGRKDVLDMLTLSVYPRYLDVKTTWDFYLFQNAELSSLKSNRLALLDEQIQLLDTLIQLKTNQSLKGNVSLLIPLKTKLKTNVSSYQEKVSTLEKGFLSSP